MPEAKIQVQYVNDPKPGKKWGSIKATDGIYYYGPPSVLQAFQVGDECTIEFENSDDGQFRQVKKKLSQTPPVLTRPIPQPPRARTNPTDSEHIFITAIAKEMVEPRMSMTEVVDLINGLRAVYRTTLGATESQRADDMSDEIPY